jgi:hypothetical protein
MEEENVQVTPCFSDDGINYMHIRHNNLYCELKRGGANHSTRAEQTEYQRGGDHLLLASTMLRTS